MRQLTLPLLAALAAGCLPAEVRQVTVKPLEEGLTFVQGGGGNSIVLVRGNRALVFDTKMWPNEDAVLDVARGANASITAVVTSHLHSDHSEANRFHPRARIHAAASTHEALAETRVGRRLPAGRAGPTLPVRGELAVNFEGERVVLVHPGPAHTGGDVFAWFPERKVLVTGDLFDLGYYPHVLAEHGGTFVGYLAALEKLCTYPAERVIPGHGREGTRADLTAMRDFVRSLHDGVRDGRARGLSDEAIREALVPRGSETYEDLGPFSNRAEVVEAFRRELPVKG
jgi:cyclase